jgi:hypothetical protein
MYSQFVLVALTLITGSVSLANRNEDFRRCHRLRNTFTLNQTNVNTVVGLACAGLSHVENERRNMNYDDSLTTFHQYESQGDEHQVTVKGYCAIPWSKLKAGQLEDKYKIDLKISRVRANEPEVKVRGKVSGRSLSLDFSSNEFFDDRCGSDEMSVKRLSRIGVGLGFGLEDIKDMLTTERTSSALYLLQNENWAQGKSNVYFSGIGVEYRMAQFNGRQLALVATSGSSASTLEIRSANYLEYAEDSGYFTLKKDSFGMASGWVNGGSSLNRDESYGTNHKLRSYPIPGGAKVLGCSSILYESELSRPADLNVENCIQRINSSALKPLQTPTYEYRVTQGELQQIRREVTERQLQTRVENYLRKFYGPVKNYSVKPGIFEQGKASWTKEDRDRGFVIVNRQISYSEDKTAVGIIESRYNLQGKPTQSTFTLQVSDMK